MEARQSIGITVYTPTFNRAHTLPRAFTSLLTQTFKSFEWLVVDDGSTDSTPRLVDEWQANAGFPIIHVAQAHAGKHVARNRAVSRARGRFVVELDSDDWLVPTALQRLLEMWEAIEPDRRGGFVGVAARCALLDGRKLGRDLPTPFVDSDLIEFKGRYRIEADMVGMNRTDILRQFAFPEIEGEWFVNEGLVQTRMGLNYKTRFFDEVLKIVEYQPGGLSDQSRTIRVKNLAASILYYEELVAVGDRLDVRRRLRASANLIRYQLHACRSIRPTRGSHPGIWLGSLPAALLLWTGDRLILRREHRRPESQA